jgi:hypothetical protein
MENVIGKIAEQEIDLKEARSSCSRICQKLLELTGPLKVIEIGTSYGFQLRDFVPLSSETVCVDPMYDWVPDVLEKDGFQPERVDQKKLETWKKNVDSFGGNAVLIVGNSYSVHSDPAYMHMFYGSSVLIVDGNHSNPELVAKDYLNYRKFMTKEHYVIWDDLNMGDVRQAWQNVSRALKEEGCLVEEKEIHETALVWVSMPL